MPLPPKIFVSRLSNSPLGAARRLQNEQALADALKEIGFAVIEPHLLPFEDQVAIFASASVVVGLGGAGMFNAVFSQSSTKVVTIESSGAFIHNHATLFSSLKLDYGVVFGARDKGDNRPPHHEWTVDVEAVVAKIREFI